jgi:hypothetical protein
VAGKAVEEDGIDDYRDYNDRKEYQILKRKNRSNKNNKNNNRSQKIQTINSNDVLSDSLTSQGDEASFGHQLRMFQKRQQAKEDKQQSGGQTINKVKGTRIFVEDENPFLLKVTSNDSMSTGINTTSTSLSNNTKARKDSSGGAGGAARHRRDVMQKLQDTVSSRKSWKNDSVIDTSK